MNDERKLAGVMLALAIMAICAVSIMIGQQYLTWNDAAISAPQPNSVVSSSDSQR
jgi:hypothetical protein